VACKQWWQHGTEPTTQTGTYQNPPDLTWQNWSVVRFTEGTLNGAFAWFFAKDQCRHCPDPMPCKVGCPNGCITKNEFGAVLIDQSKCGNCEVQCAQYCPYGGIPKREVGPDGVQYCRVFKCRMCEDRIAAGKSTACASTCPAGAIHFGDKTEMVAVAEARLLELKNLGWGDAIIYPGTAGNAMWLLLKSRENYQLAEYREHVPGRSPANEEPRKMLAKTDSREMPPRKGRIPISGSAVLVGTLALGALKALADRKAAVASLDEDK